MDTKVLNEMVEFIRKTFFSRWDNERRWTFRLSPKVAPESGRCIIERNLIRISPSQSNPMALLIHEICHAVCPNCSHGSGWQRRMLKAAQRAEDIGNPELGQWLRREVEQYRGAENRTKRSMFIDIEELVQDPSEIPTFAAVRRHFCSESGWNLPEFNRILPRAWRVYKQAVAERQNTLAQRAIK
jgi:hypothetical protein